MDKRKRTRIIHKRIDGELNKTETRKFKRDVLNDEKGREEYEKMKFVAEESKNVKPVKPPPGFAGKILRAIRGKKSSHQ